MKLIAKLFLVLSLLSVSGFAVWAKCQPGNNELKPIGGGESLCCVPVGDGSVLSCTDGDTWFNVPSIDTVEP